MTFLWGYPETDGCSELTCIYHGEENQRKRDESPANCARCHRVLGHNPDLSGPCAFCNEELLALKAEEADEAYAEMMRDYDEAENGPRYADAQADRDFADYMNPVDQGFYDDDPSPYAGDYSEE